VLPRYGLPPDANLFLAAAFNQRRFLDAVNLRAFADADEAVAVAVGGRGALAVVGDFELELVRPVADRHVCLAGVGVLERIRSGLLGRFDRPIGRSRAGVDYYAEYLLREHRNGLLAFCFQRDMSEQELREGVLRSFEAVRELAATTPELRGWRDKYFFLAAAYEERLADDGPLGVGFSSLYRGIARVPDEDRPFYSPIRPRILELLKRDGLKSDEAALVQDCAYITAVCSANCYIADALARDQRNGLLSTGVHLRLDDDWQAGGIWRAERSARSCGAGRPTTRCWPRRRRPPSCSRN
jgi:hypothetical protein